MILNKAASILTIYDHLLAGKPCHIKDFMEICGISKRTALRYISDIKTYIATNHTDLILLYDRKENSYLIVKAQ